MNMGFVVLEAEEKGWRDVAISLFRHLTYF